MPKANGGQSAQLKAKRDQEEGCFAQVGIIEESACSFNPKGLKGPTMSTQRRYEPENTACKQSLRNSLGHGITMQRVDLACIHQARDRQAGSRDRPCLRGEPRPRSQNRELTPSDSPPTSSETHQITPSTSAR